MHAEVTEIVAGGDIMSLHMTVAQESAEASSCQWEKISCEGRGCWIFNIVNIRDDSWWREREESRFCGV